MINKRGISGVVTAILLILLAVAAVIIVWSVVKPMIDKAGTEGPADCLRVNLEIVSATKGATAASGTVVVKRNPGSGDLTGITIRVLDSTGNADTDPCKEGTIVVSSLDELDTITCDVTGIADVTAWDEVEVYAMVGPQKVLCPNFESTNNIGTTA